MRISALATAAGVPVATVKYYLREGLLHAGETTSPTQARYDASHVERLRLVRALLDVGRLSIASAKEVVRCLDGESVYDTLGLVQQELPPHVPADVDVSRAADLVADLGWRVERESAAMRQLAVAVQAAQDVGLPLSAEALETYGAAARMVAEHEISGMPRESASEAIAYAVVGTVLYEPILLALRRLAHQEASARAVGP